MSGTLKYIHQQQTYVTVRTISYLEWVVLPTNPSTARKAPQKMRHIDKASTSAYTLDDKQAHEKSNRQAPKRGSFSREGTPAASGRRASARVVASVRGLLILDSRRLGLSHSTPLTNESLF
jgi:hypothetical protein